MRNFLGPLTILRNLQHFDSMPYIPNLWLRVGAGRTESSSVWGFLCTTNILEHQKLSLCNDVGVQVLCFRVALRDYVRGWGARFMYWVGIAAVAFEDCCFDIFA